MIKETNLRIIKKCGEKNIIDKKKQKKSKNFEQGFVFNLIS